ncbi:hypothetical protein SAMN04488601_102260 [Paenibacillus sp. 453mf]|nr:hypothetical protein SAMN04488601_102260 [Paenibacillus sp. 453mf]
MKVIHAKRFLAIQNGKKTINLRDQQFLKEAEKLLYVEIAVVMVSTKDAVKYKIDSRLEKEFSAYLDEHELGS